MHDTGNGTSFLQLPATSSRALSRSATLSKHPDGCRKIWHATSHEPGFFAFFCQAAYGGLDLTPMDGIAVFEELAKADASVAWCVWNGNTHWTAAQLSPEAAHAIHDDPTSSRPTVRAPRVRRMSSTAASA